jgi:hypothetical protein
MLHENEEWRVMPLGGINLISDDLVRLIAGGIQLDLSLGGPEPFTAMYAAPMDSRDGGETWSELGQDIDLFPEWTEMYGASNPHRLSDGRLMWAVIGTMGRDDQWHCGVTFTDAEGKGLYQTDHHRLRARPQLRRHRRGAHRRRPLPSRHPRDERQGLLVLALVRRREDLVAHPAHGVQGR